MFFRIVFESFIGEGSLFTHAAARRIRGDRSVFFSRGGQNISY